MNNIKILNNCILLIISINILFITSCADTRKNGEMWSYGIYCGPDEPHVEYKNKEEYMKKIELCEPPKDDIDLACKEHDICYVENGYFNYECDKILLNKLKKMRFRGKHSAECLSVALQIQTWFSGFSPSLKPGHILAMPLRLTLSPIMAIPHGMMMLLNGESTPIKAGKCNSVQFY